jgi:hypothetical protein
VWVLPVTGGVATNAEVVAAFLRIPYANLSPHNWGCAASRDDAALWHVGEGTYINGVMLTVDMDYIMGWLLEVVDRESGALRYLVVVVWHGQRADGTWDHEWRQYAPECGVFFERTPAADPRAVGCWAVQLIADLVDGRPS